MAFPNGWGYQATLTIDHTKVSADVANFPVLCNWTGTQATSNLPLDIFDTDNAGHVAKSDGSDIRFSSDALGLTALAFEVVNFGTSAGGTGVTAQIWVKLTVVSSSVDTVFYCWYHNPLAAALAVNDTYGRNAVWSNGYVSVYHFEADNFTSSTGSYDGTNVNSTNTSGLFGGAKNFNGTSAGVACGDQDLTVGTWSAWAKADSTTQANNAKIVAKTTATAASPYTMYNVTLNSATPKTFRTEISVGTTQYNSGNTVQINTSAYQFLLGRYDGSNLSMWVDGVQSGSNTAISGTIAVNNDPLNIGRAYFGGTAIKEWFDGNIDEARIQTTARANGWILTEYNCGSSPQTFITPTSANYVGPVMVGFN